MPEPSAKGAVRLGKQRKALERTEIQKPQQAQQAQPREMETYKSEPSFDGSEASMKVPVKCESDEKPLFVVADWTTRFLPTLYHVLFCSEKPFHEFSRGSRFAAIVQKVLNLVHPGNTYVVTTTCKIYKTVSLFPLPDSVIHSLFLGK